MADTWDMSFLVDQSTQIQEARGNLGRHFGMLQQVLIGKHLVNFVHPDDRLGFLRMMSRLSQRNRTNQVSFRFRTPLSGERRVALLARPGSGPMAWWLMISENSADQLPLISEVEVGDAFTSEDEFSVLAQGAVGDGKRELDISVFRAAILEADQPRGGLSEAKSAALDKKIGETLQESATGGLVARPEPGHFTLMHDREIPAQHLANQINATAAEAGVSADDLGLTHNTQPMPVDADAKAMRQLMRDMRHTLKIRASSQRKASLFDHLKSLVGRG